MPAGANLPFALSGLFVICFPPFRVYSNRLMSFYLLICLRSKTCRFSGDSLFGEMYSFLILIFTTQSEDFG